MGSSCLKSTVAVLQDEQFCGWVVTMVAQHWECTQCLLILHLKWIKMENVTVHVLSQLK